MTVCPSTRPDRLYEYVKGHDYFMGPLDHECTNETRHYKGGWVMEQDVLIDTPHFCEICACYCFEPLVPLLGNFSVRYLSSKLTIAMWLKGYVVAGVKFERIKDQIHVRIAQGIALPNRKIDPKTIQWLPLVSESENRRREINYCRYLICLIM